MNDFIKLLKKLKGEYIFICILVFVSVTIAALYGYYTLINKVIYDQIFKDFNEQLLIKTCMIFLMLLISIAFLNLIKSFILSKIENDVLSSMRKSFMNKLMGFEYRYFINHNTSDIVKRICDDTQIIAEGLSQICFGISNIIIILIWIFFLFAFVYWLAIIYLVSIIISFGWVIAWKKPIEKSSLKIGNEYSDLYNHLWKAIPGVKLIKYELLKNNVLKKLNTILNKLTKVMMKNTFFCNLLWNINYPLHWGIFLFALVMGIGELRAGTFTIGLLVVCLMIVWRIMEPVSQMYSILISYQGLKTALKRIENYETGVPERGGEIEFKGIKNDISFINLDYKYPDGLFQLNNVNITIKKGESIAILGKTGSGKSTIFNLLVRLLNAKNGSINFDNNPISDFSLASIRNEIILISQESNLYNMSLRENIDIKNKLNDIEISHLLMRLNLNTMVSKLPEGLDTMIHENGSNLSGGEQKRICIARAMGLHGSIYLFDEVTANLDPQTVNIVINSIFEWGKDITKLFITHNLDFIQKMDKVFLVENNTIKQISQGKNNINKKEIELLL